MSRRARTIVLAVAAAAFVTVAATLAFVLTRTEPRVLTWQALRNATYPVSLVPRGAQLRDGLYEAEAAPGSATKIVVRLADVGAFGDLDVGRADIEAAVVLTSSGGGSGTFVEIAAVRDENGVARPVATTLLGDRVLVREIRIDTRRIFVRMRVRGATDPFTLLTREISRHYALDGDQLVLLDESETQVQGAPAEDYVYRPERVDVPPGASRTLSGSLNPGGIASYLVSATAGEALDLTLRSEFDNAALSVSGISDGITYLSRSDYATRRTVTLPSDQDYAVRVVGLAGYTLPYTLQVGRIAPTRSPAPTVRPTDAPLPSVTPRPQPTAPGASAPAERSLGQISDAAQTFARAQPPIWGAAAYVPTRGVIYAENADEQVPTASVVKVLVLLTLLEEARQDRRPLTDDELALAWPMITESDNDATSELWERIGRGQAVLSYLRVVGVSGFTPDPGRSWGVSFVSARALATMVGKLAAGEILDAPSRALAMKMLESVVPEQRWGATAGTSPEAGDHVGVKNGWYPGDEGWRVNSVALVRPASGVDYAIAVITNGRPTWEDGIATISGIAGPLNAALRVAH